VPVRVNTGGDTMNPVLTLSTLEREPTNQCALSDESSRSCRSPSCWLTPCLS